MPFILGFGILVICYYNCSNPLYVQAHCKLHMISRYVPYTLYLFNFENMQTLFVNTLVLDIVLIALIFCLIP